MSETKRPRGVRTAVILILLLPLFGISFRILNEGGDSSKGTPAREVDLSVDVSQLGFDETIAYVNERCAGFTYWEAGTSANLKVTTLPVTLERDGRLHITRRYASGGVLSSSWFTLSDVAISEYEAKDAATGTPYTAVRFECAHDCVAYATTVPGRADAEGETRTTGRATLMCAYGDQVIAAFLHMKGLLGASITARDPAGMATP